MSKRPKAKQIEVIEQPPRKIAEVDPVPDPERLQPSSLGINYDPITDTVSRRFETDSEGKIVSDVRFDPPEKVVNSRRFMPRDCTMCVTRRKPGESYARVYAKVGKIRYCKCGLCGHTWAQEGE